MTLERIEADIGAFALATLLWLIQRLAAIIQRELRQMQSEFVGAEADGLDAEI